MVSGRGYLLISLGKCKIRKSRNRLGKNQNNDLNEVRKEREKRNDTTRAKKKLPTKNRNNAKQKS
jgi:hypothetical protein